LRAFVVSLNTVGVGFGPGLAQGFLGIVSDRAGRVDPTGKEGTARPGNRTIISSRKIAG
jgi:hypothetical protein